MNLGGKTFLIEQTLKFFGILKIDHITKWLLNVCISKFIFNYLLKLSFQLVTMTDFVTDVPRVMNNKKYNIFLIKSDKVIKEIKELWLKKYFIHANNI